MVGPWGLEPQTSTVSASGLKLSPFGVWCLQRSSKPLFWIRWRNEAPNDHDRSGRIQEPSCVPRSTRVPGSAWCYESEASPTIRSTRLFVSTNFGNCQFSASGCTISTILVSNVFQQLGEPGFRSPEANSDVMRAYDSYTVRSQSPIPISAWFDRAIVSFIGKTWALQV